MTRYVNIHAHRLPREEEIGLRTVGIHPWDAERAAGLPEIAGLLEVTGLQGAGLPEAAGIQAVGEIGLDFAKGPAHEVQAAALRAQLRMACERGLPVVLHCVRAFEPLMRELAVCEPRAVIFHGFIGSPQQARQALGRGYYLSFGVRTFASPRSIEALRATPSDRLFLETDEDPAPIAAVYEEVARLRGETVDALCAATYGNYERLFGKQNG